MFERLRPDLEVCHALDGGGCVRVKDPIRSRYYQFSELQWHAAEMLATSSNVTSWLEAVTERWGESAASSQRLIGFLEQLRSQGLLAGSTAAADAARAASFPRWNPLAIRLLTLPTHPWLPWLASRAAPLYQPITILGMATLWFAAIWTLLLGWPEFWQDIIELLERPTLIGVASGLILMSGVKLIHELGHAVTSYHFGAKCREVGAMLFVLTPCLYADVSDGWMLPRRGPRIAITLAGIVFESTVAAVAVLIWSVTQPGQLHSACVFVVSVVVLGNVVLNLNPLMRFDGYYLLSDVWGRPNLHQQSRASLTRWLERWILGWPVNRSNALLNVFAVLAGIYRWMILVAILLMLGWWLSAWSLQWLAVLIGLILVAAAGFKAVSQFMERWRLVHSLSGQSMWRSRLGVLMVLMIVGIGFLIPLPCVVRGTGRSEFENATPIIVTRSGQWQSKVESNQVVTQDQILGQLVDDEHRQRLAEWISQREIVRAAEELERRSAAVAESEPGAVQTRTKELERIDSVIDSLVTQQRLLEIRSPISGRLLATHHSSHADGSSFEQESLGWTGVAFHPVNDGAWLKAGTQLGWVVPESGRMELVVWVDERAIADLAVGQSVVASARSDPLGSLTGRVTQVALKVTQQSTESPDDVGSEAMRALTGIEPAYGYAEVRIQLTGSPKQLSHFEPIRVKIRVGSQSLASRALRWARQHLRLPL